MRSLALLFGVVAALGACSGAPPVGEGEGEGEGEPTCFIGDPNEPAEIVLIGVAQLPVGQEDLVDGIELPLLLPPEDGRVVLISVRARNVSCRLLIRVAVHDPCLSSSEGGVADVDGDLVSLDARPITLAVDDDGFGRPELGSFQNFSNVPLCPAFRAPGDMNDQPFIVDVTVGEVPRDGEATAREHTLDPVRVTPVCPNDDDGACACECDGDLVLELPADEQCPVIHDNDLEFGVCPTGCAARVEECPPAFHCEDDDGVAACVLDDRPEAPVFIEIGNPPWQPTDCVMVSGIVGDAVDSGPAFESYEAFWGGHRWDDATLSIAPDEVHLPPYDDEVSANALALGLTSTSVFPRAAWTAPAGVHLYCVLVPIVPDAQNIGSSSDFPAGPIIREELFPLFIDADVFRDGVDVGGAFDDAEPPDTFAPAGESVDGYSHVPLSVSMNSALVSDASAGGLMELQVRVSDARGDGWLMRFPFELLAE
jgi:hypothetical protein